MGDLTPEESEAFKKEVMEYFAGQTIPVIGVVDGELVAWEEDIETAIKSLEDE